VAGGARYADTAPPIDMFISQCINIVCAFAINHSISKHHVSVPVYMLFYVSINADIGSYRHAVCIHVEREGGERLGER